MPLVEHLSARRVLSRDEAMAIGHELLTLVSDHAVGVSIEHTARAVTKVSHQGVLNADDGDRVRIVFTSQCGSGLPISIQTNQLNRTTLRRVVAYTEAIAPPKAASTTLDPVDYAAEEPVLYQARAFPPVSLWHDTTIQAMDTARSTIVPALMTQVHASRLTGVSTVGFAARSVLYLYKYGLSAFCDETDCELTMTVRAPDSNTSGWSGQAHRDWTQLVPNTVATQAIELAQRNRNPVALEPGRRLAILGPAAVAQLVWWMAPAFSGENSRARGRHGTPFTVVNDERNGRHTKLGLRVFDPRIMMVSDPADPLGGFPPFFERYSTVEFQMHGFPTPSVTWVDHGILRNMAYRVGDAYGRGVSPCEVPRSVRIASVPGTETATVEQMIANCRSGIYVHRFSDVTVLDGETGLMTGVTCDGCFLVKNGKIEKPIKNFRFVDSPFLALNNVEMIGEPERVAFGYNAPPGGGEEPRWPRLPVIVPPLMIRDFNFSGLAEAV